MIGTPQTLLFTAGPDEESHGLFGESRRSPNAADETRTGARGRTAAGARRAFGRRQERPTPPC